jgi:hypothetical protein
MGELPVERDECVGLELGQSDVLGVKGVRPPELPLQVRLAGAGERS